MSNPHCDCEAHHCCPEKALEALEASGALGEDVWTPAVPRRLELRKDERTLR